MKNKKQVVLINLLLFLFDKLETCNWIKSLLFLLFDDDDGGFLSVTVKSFQLLLTTCVVVEYISKSVFDSSS